MGRKKLVSDEQLLEVARNAFAERGLSASTREIARRAGVSEAILFQRYATKADLFFAAMVPPTFDLKTYLPDPIVNHSGERVIRDVFFGLLNYFREASPVIVQLLATQNFEFEEFAKAHPDNALVTLRWSLVAFLDELKSVNKIGGDPRFAALAMIMSAQSLALFERLGAHGGTFSDPMVNALITTLWSGLRPQAATHQVASSNKASARQ